MKRVFASQDRTALAIVQGLLADEGIEATVQNENLSAVTGEVPFTLTMPEIWVLRDEDEALARAIVERFDSGEARADAPSEPWKCSHCGEMIEGQFTACWHCGTPLHAG